MFMLMTIMILIITVLITTIVIILNDYVYDNYTNIDNIRIINI